MSMLSAGTMNGTSINDPQGENLGDIKDLMIDLESGRVAYAVVQFGGLLGFGGKLFAVPLKALRQDAENKCFVLHTDKKTLEQATGFDKDHWPDFADRRWQEAVHKHFDTSPYWL
jgi:sporulation protein YlmC with PRC-barrel domain